MCFWQTLLLVSYALYIMCARNMYAPCTCIQTMELFQQLAPAQPLKLVSACIPPADKRVYYFCAVSPQEYRPVLQFLIRVSVELVTAWKLLPTTPPLCFVVALLHPMTQHVHLDCVSHALVTT